MPLKDRSGFDGDGVQADQVAAGGAADEVDVHLGVVRIGRRLVDGDVDHAGELGGDGGLDGGGGVGIGGAAGRLQVDVEVGRVAALVAPAGALAEQREERRRR